MIKIKNQNVKKKESYLGRSLKGLNAHSVLSNYSTNLWAHT